MQYVNARPAPQFLTWPFVGVRRREHEGSGQTERDSTQEMGNSVSRQHGGILL